MEVPIDSSVCDTTSNSVAFFEKVPYGVFHKDVNAFVYASFLQCPNEFKTGCIADVSEAWEGVTSEVSLVDEVLSCAIKNGSKFRPV